MKLLEGKIALVTGATRGIGRAIAETFAKQGATVVFTYRSSVEKAQSLEESLKAEGAECLSFQADAADFEATQNVINGTLEKFGRIDVIVNNAGITKDNLLLRMSEEQWDQVINTNLNSVFYTTKAALRAMLKQRAGSIINISSVVGLQGNAGQANYAASKAGMVGFTKSMAREVGSRGIRANVVAPGFIATEMTAELPEKELATWLEGIPLKRAGEPQDVADLCVFLASDMSNYITGQVFNVDGGMVMA
ncbi:3-oxoacyl-[acyl-carrier-protein] reductase [Pontibacter sp. G13]|uniref:3-oxoacyl-[acyl-carrier-protein] reductase n=1 Tax=Pontibacter sp. G13 TaxID=3074898 RepID=UPI00288B8737|nr:3-oxoacyl-[acyl-carrier-protein] reductase [Pontibacter sp. G13]WNJ16628.1 3-oxoacyl-[acyl-carrier-protein] reductase [Pontibacter sp. G13]